MITDLKLKGVPLMAYACIYGFTQEKGQTFQGGLEYIMDWTNSTKRGVINALNYLLDRGLIEKIASEKDKRKVMWRAKIGEQSIPKIGEQSSPIDKKIGEQSSPNRCTKFTYSVNPPYNPPNKVENTKRNIYIPPKLPPQSQEDKTASDDAAPVAPKGGVSETVKTVISYLNEKTGKRFSPKSAMAVRHITARLKEGYALEDFKTVIDKKVAAWKGDERMAQYLRPETLFGSKFDGYLNEVTAPKSYKAVKSETYDYAEWERTHDEFGNPIGDTR